MFGVLTSFFPALAARSMARMSLYRATRVSTTDDDSVETNKAESTASSYTYQPQQLNSVADIP